MFSLLSSDFLPRWSSFTSEQMEPAIRHALAEAKKRIDAIASQNPDEATYESTFLALEAATESLSHGWGRLNHLDSVCDSPAQREAINALLPEVSDFYSSISLNAELFQVLKALALKQDSSRSPIIQRHISETLADFVESGAELPAEKKQRIAAIDSELSKLTKQYSEHVLDATNAWEIVITEEAQLAGLPDSAKASAAANARSKNLEAPAWRFTLQAPSMMPIMLYAENAELRKQVWAASTMIGSEAPYENTELVWEILKLRQEKAQLLGHENFADLTLQRRMAGDGKTALDFVQGLRDRVHEAFIKDFDELCAYKAKKTGTAIEILEPWETAYWAELRRKEQYDLDEEDLRPYFSVNRVMEGMFQICSTLFGIRIQERDTSYYELGKTQEATPSSVVETWHPEVKFYEIYDVKTEAHLGSFYADWHPRESKRGGAWMNSLHTGKLGEPHLGLMVGNMSPPIDGKPALLTHREVETIFHEFGHLLHGLLSEVPVKSLAGTNVAWDFVELPSQIMENFCWARESLDLFARHHETDEVIPQDLFDKMIAAKNYMSATGFMRQLAFGKLDLELHLQLSNYLERDLSELDREILADYRAPSKTQSPSMALRFNHLFSSPTGYAAGYYSYKWAEVLDADAFTRFQNEGVLNPKTGYSFREQILSKGNSEPPDLLFEKFMARPADSSALLLRAGLA